MPPAGTTNRPNSTPRRASRCGPKSRRAISRRTARYRIPTWIGLAAAIVIGVALGRFTPLDRLLHPAPAVPAPIATPIVAAAPSRLPVPAVYEPTTSQYLGQTAALLVALPIGSTRGAGRPPVHRPRAEPPAHHAPAARFAGRTGRQAPRAARRPRGGARPGRTLAVGTRLHRSRSHQPGPRAARRIAAPAYRGGRHFR